MARVPRRHRPVDPFASPAVVALTQAQNMIGIYTEILAMHETVMERVRHILVRQSVDDDHEADLTNLRLILTQLEKLGERTAFWNDRLQTLVKSQLPA
jgi:hypothetical protein